MVYREALQVAWDYAYEEQEGFCPICELTAAFHEEGCWYDLGKAILADPNPRADAITVITKAAVTMAEQIQGYPTPESCTWPVLTAVRAYQGRKDGAE